MTSLDFSQLSFETLDALSIRTGCETEKNRRADIELRRRGYIFNAQEQRWEAQADPVSMAPPKCVIGEYCRTHGFVHGAEAEELRERLEKLLENRRFSGSEVRYILDDVDARDSCAFVEARASLPSGPPQEPRLAAGVRAVLTLIDSGLSDVSHIGRLLRFAVDAAEKLERAAVGQPALHEAPRVRHVCSQCRQEFPAEASVGQPALPDRSRNHE